MRSLAPAAAALALLTVLGCHTARMRVDSRLAAGADAYAVSGANPRVSGRPIAFGPWRTGPVSGEGSTEGTMRIAGAYEKTESHRPFALRITGPGGAIDADCHERRSESTTMRVITVDERAAAGLPVLACTFQPGTPDRGGVWTLDVRTLDDGGFAGELRDPGGATAYALRSSHAVEGMSVDSPRLVGWILERGGGPAAAVETNGSGRVFLPRGVPERSVLAAAAAALLLFEPYPK